MFAAALEHLAICIRGLIDAQVDSLVAAERRTINVRVEQLSDAKSTQLAIKKLKASHKWVITEQRRLQLLQQRRKEIGKLLNMLVDALMRSTKSIVILLLVIVVIAGWAWVGGMNSPSIIACPNTTGLCYRARWRSPKLIVPFPEQTQCMDTADGLVCLFKHEPLPTKKPHTTKKQKSDE